jgi:hypothetical protein
LKILKGVGIAVGIAGLVYLCFFFIRRFRSRYEYLLELQMKKGKTRKVVKHINRRLYYMLRFSSVNIWFRKRWTDEEYRNALVERFIDVEADAWDRYMDIVKKNHYSHEVITIEEMQHCYDCYTKVKLFRLKR